MLAKRALIDLNVILDVLEVRLPFYEASAHVLSLCETGEISGFICAHSVTTLMYLLSKGRSANDAKVVLTSLMQFLKVLKVDQTTIEQALNLNYKDFEDAVQAIAALQNQLDFIVTRNVRDYQPSPVSVVQPAELGLLI